jgi:hypothetical protein
VAMIGWNLVVLIGIKAALMLYEFVKFVSEFMAQRMHLTE